MWACLRKGSHNNFFNCLLLKQALVFTYLQQKSFENTVGKGQIAHNEQFLLFQMGFLRL